MSETRLAGDQPAVPTQDAATALLQRDFWRDETIALTALLLVAVFAWAWIVYLARGMAAMADMPEMAAMPWDIGNILFTWAMWSVMMAAMMLPAAAPIALLHRRVGAHNRIQGAKAPPTSLLVVGYLLVWVVFSVLATAAQAALSIALQFTPMLALANGRLAGVVLIVAGLYQFTSLKRYCLVFCRSPFIFLSQHYHPGALGALRMGVIHGCYCLICCWTAMALLFVGGVMNLLWIAGLTAFVLIEKVVPFGRSAGLILGGGAVLSGLYLLAGYSLPFLGEFQN